MKTFLFTILTLISTIGFCQVTWFPEGAKWHYELQGWESNGITILEVIPEDTMIGNKMYKKILSTTIFVSTEAQVDTAIDFLYVHEDQGLVLGYHLDFGGSFLYNFNAMPGDTIPMLFGGYSPTPFVLDSVGVIEYNGESRRFQDIRFPDFQDPNVFWELRVVEGIGSINSHLFHMYTIIQPFDFPYYYIRCYEDPETGLINLTHLQEPCDYIEGITSIPTPISGAATIFPNPASDLITVSYDVSEIDGLKVYDRLGTLRITKWTDALDFVTLDITALEPGLFFICGISKEGHISFTEKLLKL